MGSRKSNRLNYFDYSSENYYFVTTCSKGMVHYFGHIDNGRMHCNQLGIIASQQWDRLLNQYSYIRSHAFVVMPNHVHAVLEISHLCRDRSRPVPTKGVGSAQSTPLQKRTETKIKSLSELMGAYKMRVSKYIHQLGYDEFTWQRSFYDHIIRNELSYNRIVDYVKYNPENWQSDRFYNA